jgi:hypothetical protein
MTVIHPVTATMGLEVVLAAFSLELERTLEAKLELRDEQGFDPRWSRALVELRGFALRPAKRVRPTLLVAGWALTHEARGLPEGVTAFAAGLELLHTFMLVHDDVADRAATRRGGPSMHRLMGGGRGETTRRSCSAITSTPWPSRPCSAAGCPAPPRPRGT